MGLSICRSKNTGLRKARRLSVNIPQRGAPRGIPTCGESEKEVKKNESEGESEFMLQKPECYEGIIVLHFARVSPHLSNAYCGVKRV